MKTKKILTLVVAFAIVCTTSTAQNKTDTVWWSLKECIDYAITHNLTIKKNATTIELNEIAKENNKWSRLPDLNGSAGTNFAWAKDAQTKEHTNNSASSFGLSTNIPLFTGLEQPNLYKQSKLNLQASISDLAKAKNDLSISITSLYIDVIFARDLIAVTQTQLAVSREQLDRGEELYALEKLSKADLYELRARLKQDEVVVVEAMNNYQIALLNLTQALELDNPTNFNVLPLQGNMLFDKLTNPDDIYMAALNYMPEIIAEEYREDAAKTDIKVAKAGFYPKLSLNAGLGTAYNTQKSVDYDPFGRQLKNNFNQYVGVTLSVPIFNRFVTKNRVKIARINYQSQLYSLGLAKKALYNEIQKAWYNATASESKYIASKEAKEANEESFNLTKEKYQLGKATNLEFNESKVNYVKAEYDLIKAKYDYLFRIKLLDFYKGKPIE